MNTTHNDKENPKRLSRHQTPNLVISCIDFRFRGDMHDALLKTFGLDDFDEIKFAGGGGNLALIGDQKENRKQTLLDDVALAVAAHKVENIYIINHQNCGAYAQAGAAFDKIITDAEKDFHASELAQAAEVIKKLYPQVNVYPVFASVDPETDEIVFIQ